MFKHETEGSFEAVLFDLDGVVINSNGPIVSFWNGLAEECGVDLTETDFVQHIYGTPARETLNKLFTALSEAEKDRVMDKLEAYENQLTYSGIPGVLDFLKGLRSSGIPTALVTSSKGPKLATVFRQLHLNDLFATVITAEDIRKGKPDPEGYLLAAGKLEKAPERCIVFEDAVSGVKAAVSAGTRCIGVHQKAEPLLRVGAKCVIPDFSKTIILYDGKRMELEFGVARFEEGSPEYMVKFS